MGRPKEVREEPQETAAESGPPYRPSGTHRRRGGMIDVVSEVGERLKDRQSRPVLTDEEVDDVGEV